MAYALYREKDILKLNLNAKNLKCIQLTSDAEKLYFEPKTVRLGNQKV